jgi:hypothetical protein
MFKVSAVGLVVSFSMYACKSPQSGDNAELLSSSVTVSCKVPTNDKVSGIGKELDVVLSANKFSFPATVDNRKLKVSGKFEAEVTYGSGDTKMLEFGGAELEYLSNASRLSKVHVSPGLLKGHRGNIMLSLVYANNEGEGSVTETIKMSCGLNSGSRLFEKYDDVSTLEEKLFGFSKHFFSKNKSCKVDNQLVFEAYGRSDRQDLSIKDFEEQVGIKFKAIPNSKTNSEKATKEFDQMAAKLFASYTAAVNKKGCENLSRFIEQRTSGLYRSIETALNSSEKSWIGFTTVNDRPVFVYSYLAYGTDEIVFVARDPGVKFAMSAR